jgi:hypothetical protein
MKASRCPDVESNKSGGYRDSMIVGRMSLQVFRLRFFRGHARTSRRLVLVPYPAGLPPSQLQITLLIFLRGRGLGMITGCATSRVAPSKR